MLMALPTSGQPGGYTLRNFVINFTDLRSLTYLLDTGKGHDDQT